MDEGDPDEGGLTPQIVKRPGIDGLGVRWIVVRTVPGISRNRPLCHD